jgi:hypothetical protein
MAAGCAVTGPLLPPSANGVHLPSADPEVTTTLPGRHVPHLELDALVHVTVELSHPAIGAHVSHRSGLELPLTASTSQRPAAQLEHCWLALLVHVTPLVQPAIEVQLVHFLLPAPLLQLPAGHAGHESINPSTK